MNSNSKVIKDLESIDWSFSSVTNSKIHSIHWYPATFIDAIPGTLIPVLSEPEATIVDPFCGSGTSAVEAIRLGRKFVGIDNNPIAVLISEAKTYFPEPNKFRAEMRRVVERAQTNRTLGDVRNHPQYEELRKWYHPQTLDDLYKLLVSISTLNQKKVRHCALAIFSGLLKKTSSQTKHWGWVCDNVKPKPHEIVFRDAIEVFLSCVEDYISSTNSTLRSIKKTSGLKTRSSIRNSRKFLRGDCLSRLSDMKKNSVDLIITSPPYYGVADYVKSQRLTYLWLDDAIFDNTLLGFKNFEKLRSTEAGSRSHRHRKDSHSKYMEFMDNFFFQCGQALKPNSYLALVLGESKSRLLTTEALIESALQSGLELNFRSSRSIKATRRRLMAKVEGEDVLVLKKKNKHYE